MPVAHVPPGGLCRADVRLRAVGGIGLPAAATLLACVFSQGPILRVLCEGWGSTHTNKKGGVSLPTAGPQAGAAFFKLYWTRLRSNESLA